jgi:hypothetical protein
MVYDTILDCARRHVFLERAESGFRDVVCEHAAGWPRANYQSLTSRVWTRSRLANWLTRQLVPPN